jgi:hypothetical protein
LNILDNITEFLRLQYWNIVTLSDDFYAWGYELLTAAFATVGLGDDGRNSIAAFNKASQGSEAKFLSPKEYESL